MRIILNRCMEWVINLPAKEIACQMQQDKYSHHDCCTFDQQHWIFFIIHYVLVHQLDKDLRIEQMEIIHYVKEKDALPEASDYKDQQIEFHLTSHDFFKTKFSTEDEFNKKENETESFRKL